MLCLYTVVYWLLLILNKVNSFAYLVAVLTNRPIPLNSVKLSYSIGLVIEKKHRRRVDFKLYYINIIYKYISIIDIIFSSIEYILHMYIEYEINVELNVKETNTQSIEVLLRVNFLKNLYVKGDEELMSTFKRFSSFRFDIPLPWYSIIENFQYVSVLIKIDNYKNIGIHLKINL